MSNVIVTRHKGLIEWLSLRGITGTVVEHATPDQVSGKHVFGILPLNLAALTSAITTVDMSGLRPDQRGKDLTPDEMDAAGATLTTYVVKVV